MFGEQFYPTPEHIAEKLLQGVSKYRINKILEPSAGKGDLAEYVKKLNKDADIDVIEIDENLQHILIGKGYRLIDNDFLRFDSLYSYDLIVMNPPFNSGVKHLLKAIDVMKNGGRIACILNAETIKNDFSKDRKYLNSKLAKLNAEIEFIENGFEDAERKTSVEVALININIEKQKIESNIFKDMKTQYMLEKENDKKGSLVVNDFLIGIMDQYFIEVNAGVNLINEYEGFNAVSLEKDVFRLGFYDDMYPGNLKNEFIKRTRLKYWNTLFKSDKFSSLMTEKQRYELQDKMDEFKNYDFTEFNIMQLQINMQQELGNNIEQAIIDLFDECSYKYAYDTYSNIHYYNGWKTNKAWKINDKVILRLNIFDDYDKSISLNYGAKEKISDFIKVCSYLDGKKFDDEKFKDDIEDIKSNKQTKKVQFDYIECDFYKKGTTHIRFKDEEVLKKFNRFGSQRKGWLPPSYGTKLYKDMNNEEQSIIDEFEGKKDYEKAYTNNQTRFNAHELLAISG